MFRVLSQLQSTSINSYTSAFQPVLLRLPILYILQTRRKSWVFHTKLKFYGGDSKGYVNRLQVSLYHDRPCIISTTSVRPPSSASLLALTPRELANSTSAPDSISNITTSKCAFSIAWCNALPTSSFVLSSSGSSTPTHQHQHPSSTETLPSQPHPPQPPV